jgi:predicted Zn-ribbon and HTH transcriptional regulator
VRTFPTGRVCEAPECTTVLSTYNPQLLCAVHAILDRDAPRSHKRQRELPLFERTCEHCGFVFETGNLRKRFCSDKCRVAAFQQRRSRSEGAALG